MRIDAVYLENFKMFSKKKMSFKGNFSLIIGDNGSGKTSILEAISIGLGGFLAGIDGVIPRNIHLEEVRIANRLEGDATYTSEYQFPCTISCEGALGDEQLHWKRSLNKREGRTDRSQAREIINRAVAMQQAVAQQEGEAITLPILSYQGAGRLYSQKRDKWTNPFEAQHLSRFTGYINCLKAESNMKLFVNWLRKMTVISLQKQKPIGELTATLSAISTFMQTMMATDEELTIHYSFELDEVVLQFDQKELPMRLMSAGYRSLIGMVADIAFRMSLLNPHLKKDAARLTPGVVLIDELDLHLHPKWQWKIVEGLKTTFPQVQFIATTHAPIVIASCRDGEVISISEERKKTQNYGWQVQDILQDVMDAENRSLEVQKKIDQYERLFSKKMEHSLAREEETKLEKLEQQLIELLPERDPAITLAKLNALKSRVREIGERS